VNPLTYLDDLVARAIMGLHSLLSHVFPADSGWAWGLSIVILVMIIRLLLVPLFVKQIHAQRKMAQHQPQLAELRKKYKNDKQKLQEEQMKFFKENGVNPLAGCLPMIPQMIVFICLFSVLRKITDWTPGTPLAYGLTKSAVESARRATIFGVHLGDKLLFPHTQTLGIRGSIIIVVSVAISASTTFMTVRQTSKRGLMQSPGVDPDNPMAASQKYMMYIVPFFSLTGLYWQYGLVLYWVTTNVWTVSQQFIMFRNWTPPVPVGDAAAAVGASSSARSPATRSAAARPGGATRPGSAARAGSAGSAGSAKTGSSAARPSGTRQGSSATRSATGTKPGVRSGATNGTKPGAAAGTKPGAATETKSEAATGTKSGATAKQGGTIGSRVTSTGTQNGESRNGTEKRRLPRLGKSKPPEPEPVEEVPETKVVRQQPTRQSRSKRSGNR
jgi:YidC/Oxa1 family membrane protein insertase